MHPPPILASLGARVAPATARLIGHAVLAFLVSRVVLAAAAQAALTYWPAVSGVTYGTWADVSPWAWVNGWSRWDGRWYVQIAQDGYQYTADGWSSTAFSPLLPALMRAIGATFGRTDDEALVMAAIGLNGALLLAALVFLGAWVRGEHGETAALWAMWALALFPSTFYLSAVYPHTLLLLAGVASLYFAQRGRWLSAALFAIVGTLARPYGVLLIVPLLVEVRWGARASARPWAWLPLLLVPFAYGLWAVYLGWVSGDPLLVTHSSAAWEKTLTPQWATLWAYLAGPVALTGTHNGLLDLGLAAALLVALALGWRWLRPSAALYLTLAWVMATLFGTFAGISRYATEWFPLFAVLGLACARSSVFRRLYLVVAPAYALFGAVGFARGWDHFGY